MISGIYWIRNKINGKIYIGSSYHILKRWSAHKRFLLRGIHENDRLQQSYNKHGLNKFEFTILIECDRPDLLVIEQMFLDIMKPDYNIAISSSAPMLGKKHSNKAKLILSKKHKGHKYNLGIKHTIETKLAQSERRKKWRWSNEVKQKMSETSKRINRAADLEKYRELSKRKVIDSNGNIHNSLVECAKFWNMSVQAVCDVLKGRTHKTKKGIVFKYVI